MKHITIVLFSFMLLLPGFTLAQRNCYSTFYQSGIEQYKANAFDAAIKSFKAAKVCPDKPAKNDVDDRIVEAQNGYIDAIQKERNKARSLALTANSILELQKNNDASKAFRYAQYALQADDNSESRSAFYEAAYQLEFDDRRLIYQNSFPAFDQYPHDLSSAEFLGDLSNILAFSTLGQLRAYNNKGQLLAEQETQGFAGNTKYFQSSGNLIAFLDNEKEQLKVVDFGKNKDFKNVIFTVPGEEPGIRAFRFSTDGKMFAVGFNNGMIKLFDRSGKLLQSFHHAQNRIDHLTFSADGEMLAASDENSVIQLWNTSGTFIDSISVSRGFDIAVEIAPDKRHLLLKTTSSRLQVLNIKGDLILEEKNHYGQIHQNNFTPDGKIVAIGNQLIILTEGSTYGKALQEISYDAYHIRFSPKGNLLLAWGYNEKAYLWEMWGGWQLKAVLGAHSNKILTAKFSKDQKHILTVGSENAIKTWPVGASVAYSAPNAGKLLCATKIKDSVYVSTHSEANLRVYNAQTGFKGSLTLPVQDIVCQSVDGEYLLVQEDADKIGLWTYGLSGDSIRWLAGVTGFDKIVHAAFSPAQKVIAIFTEGNSTLGLQLWDFKNHKTRFLSGWNGEITSLAWSADGSQLFGSSLSGELYTWDYSKGFENAKLIKTDQLHQSDPIKAIAVSPDGRLLITSPLFGSDQIIWDVDGHQVASFNCRCQTNMIHFSPDSRFFITAEDHSANIWDISGQLLVNLDIGKANVDKAYFSNDGSYVVTNYSDGAIMIWPFQPELITASMEKLGVPDLSLKEKEKYGIGK